MEIRLAWTHGVNRILNSLSLQTSWLAVFCAVTIVP